MLFPVIVGAFLWWNWQETSTQKILGQWEMLRGCLFGLPNNFQTLKAGSPNKHLEAWGQLRSLEAHESVCNTGSSEACENQLREFSQKLPRLPLLSEDHCHPNHFLCFISSLAIVTLASRDSQIAARLQMLVLHAAFCSPKSHRSTARSRIGWGARPPVGARFNAGGWATTSGGKSQRR
jgi:hypothetical protein